MNDKSHDKIVEDTFSNPPYSDTVSQSRPESSSDESTPISSKKSETIRPRILKKKKQQIKEDTFSEAEFEAESYSNSDSESENKSNYDKRSKPYQQKDTGRVNFEDSDSDSDQNKSESESVIEEKHQTQRNNFNRNRNSEESKERNGGRNYIASFDNAFSSELSDDS
mmetsp:Transcript_22501/g.25012  ORF Transcript_22501/g.25012 Transcript_22501/m.25012 type:complete len:167 (+) Transcript_22501:3-503(+)